MDAKKWKQAALKAAEKSAEIKAEGFCRLWLGQEKVPRALLEAEVKED